MASSERVVCVELWGERERERESYGGKARGEFRLLWFLSSINELSVSV